MTPMKAIQLTGLGRHRLRSDLAIPEPGRDEVRVRVAAAGIRGTDVHICGTGVERFAKGLLAKVVLYPAGRPR